MLDNVGPPKFITWHTCISPLVVQSFQVIWRDWEQDTRPDYIMNCNQSAGWKSIGFSRHDPTRHQDLAVYLCAGKHIGVIQSDSKISCSGQHLRFKFPRSILALPARSVVLAFCAGSLASYQVYSSTVRTISSKGCERQRQRASIGSWMPPEDAPQQRRIWVECCPQ